jgi:hypothetical protein
MKIPRLPTDDELDQMAVAVAGEEVGYNKDESLEFLQAARVAVFDDYISDGPGYVGKVATVVWPGGPSLFDVFTWDGDGAVVREKD